MRKSNSFLLYLTLNFLVLIFLFAHAGFHANQAESHLRTSIELVRELQLTDLCIFTEARYTRHLTQADLNTAFQDHPVCLEHFPSGSLLMPPEKLRRPYERIH